MYVYLINTSQCSSRAGAMVGFHRGQAWSISGHNQWHLANASRWLPSWWLNQPIWKILVKMGIFPNRGENKKYLKPPPSSRCFFYQKNYRRCAEIPVLNWVKPALLGFPTLFFTWCLGLPWIFVWKLQKLKMLVPKKKRHEKKCGIFCIG